MSSTSLEIQRRIYHFFPSSLFSLECISAEYQTHVCGVWDLGFFPVIFSFYLFLVLGSTTVATGISIMKETRTKYWHFRRRLLGIIL